MRRTQQESEAFHANKGYRQTFMAKSGTCISLARAKLTILGLNLSLYPLFPLIGGTETPSNGVGRPELSASDSKEESTMTILIGPK